MAQKNPLYYNVAPANVEAFNTTDRSELGFVGGEDGKSGYIVTKGRKFGMSTEDVENKIKDAGEQIAGTGKYISSVSLTTGLLEITETELPKPEVDTNHDSFNVGDTKYTLAVDTTSGKLKITSETPASVSITGFVKTETHSEDRKIEYGNKYTVDIKAIPSNTINFNVDLGTEEFKSANMYLYPDLVGTGEPSAIQPIGSEQLSSGSITIESSYTDVYAIGYQDTTYSITVTENGSYYTPDTINQSAYLEVTTDKQKYTTDPVHVASTHGTSKYTPTYRFIYTNQEITEENWDKISSCNFYAGGTDRPKNLTCPGSTDQDARYCIAFPAAWAEYGDPELSTKLGDDTSSWSIKKNATFYKGNVAYKVWMYNQHQDDNGTWTITWK